MYNTSEQFSELNQATLDHAMKFAHIALDNAEKMVKVQLEASKTAIEDSANNAKAAIEIKDPQEIISLRAKLAESSIEKALSYSRSIYEVASQTQSELTKLAEEGLAAYTKGISAFVDKAVKSAPAGSDVAVTALRSTVAATAAAFDTLTKASKQVANFADASVKAATQATAAAVKQPVAPAPSSRKVA